MQEIIGRKYEAEILGEAMQSGKSELIAIYGRRRIGKTYLIRDFYKNDIIFEVTGLYKGGMRDQLKSFMKEISVRAKLSISETPTKWLDAFTNLENYLDKCNTNKKKVIFIDEFPWIATPKSKFLMAFENFWNYYCTKRNDLIVVICGSAASYMIQKIIRNKGGLHNRTTRQIRLLPFNLHETMEYIESKGIQYTNYDIMQVYMAMGGVPYYLEKLRKGLSVAQNIDQLCFEKDGVLRNEFDQLFASLFEDSEKHLDIIKVLAKTNRGATRQEIIDTVKVQSGGSLSLKLEELIESGFVSEYTYFGKTKNQSLFRLSDEYSKFYLKFIVTNKNNGAGTWQRLHKSPSFLSWAGFSFESLSLKHINQIKNGLRIGGIYSTSSSWFNDHTQVDLVIDRDDNIINLCEIKFHKGHFSIDKDYYNKLKNKIAQLESETKTRKNIYLTMITSFGIKENAYSQELVQNTIELNTLFAS